MTSILTPAFRWLSVLVMALALLVALFMAGTRWWLFPQINQFRPWIAAQLSTTLGVQVDIGHLQVRWQRWHLGLQVHDLSLHSENGRHLLSLPEAGALLSWRSLAARQPRFTRLHLQGLDLTVHRETHDRVDVLGQTVPVATRQLRQLPLHSRAMQWLLTQPQVHVSQSTLRWVDDARHAPPLVWNDVAFSIRNAGRSHQFGLTAHSAAGEGVTIDIRGQLARHTEASRIRRLDGELYLDLEGRHPQSWQPWVSWPGQFEADRVRVQAWVDVEDSTLTTMLADIHAEQPAWAHHEGVSASAGQGRALIRMPVRPWPQAGKLEVRMQAHHARLLLDALPGMPLFARAISAHAELTQDDEGLGLDVSQLVLDSPDAQATGRLQWTNRGHAAGGHLDMDLNIPWARIAAVPRYMPQEVDADVRDWLAHALQAGVVENGHVALQGPMVDFPFHEPKAGQRFVVHAPYRNARVDYDPAPASGPGWPLLHGMQGQVDIDAASIRIRADQARMTPAESGDILLEQVDAAIPDMRHQATLRVDGNTRADAAVYLDLMRHSPLSAMLEHTFDASQGEGQWSVPLGLTIPLQDDDAVQVDGRIRMQQSALQLTPEYPALSGLDGELVFTQNTVIVPGLAGELFGRPARLSGGVGPGQPGLQLDGRVSAATLAELAGVAGARRLSGEAPYTATLTGTGPAAAGPPELTVRSTLEGMAMDFPSPLGKPAEQALPLEVVWQHGDQPGDRHLAIRLSERLSARFSHAGQGSDHAWFQAGSMGVGEKAQWPEQGLSVAITQPQFDLDAWDRITREFAPPADTDGATATPLFPRVRYLQLNAQQATLLGMDLTDLAYRFWQDGALDWRADIQSEEAVGQLAWTEADGHPQGPVNAHFDYLRIGGSQEAETASDDASKTADSAEAATESWVQDDMVVPAVSLQIDHLDFHDMALGALTLDGVPHESGDVWDLKALTLRAPGMALNGQGQWRLRGSRRGLTLDVVAETSDMGGYLEQIGFTDTMAQGQGTVEAAIQWLDLPWTMDGTRLSGDIGFSMADGRLNTVNSDAARLLELLSFQSMQRLTRLDINPLDLTREGFPFDILRGTLQLKQGRLRTDDYQIAGPVGSIVVDGELALDTGALALDAVVVPNLDVSGAAIAAGLVVNPIVGLGAFLTQWVLKDPLADAMAVRYHIGGTLKAPEVEPQKKLTQKEQAREKPEPTTP